MLRRRAEKASAILRKFVAERFVFTPNQAGGYLFQGRRRSRPTTSNGVPNGNAAVTRNPYRLVGSVVWPAA